MSNEAKNVEAFEARFQELTAFVEEALDTVQSDSMPDLANLEDRVSGLCQDIETADEDTAAKVQPLMAEMIGKLDTLAQALNDYKEKAQGSD